MTNRARRVRLLLLTTAVLAAGAITVKYTRHQVLPRRFAVVVPGQIYRSGILSPWPMQRVMRDHGIRTILTLLKLDPDSSEQAAEQRYAQEHGIKLVRIAMPGDGRGEFDDLERAADVIAESGNYPMLVHCAAGRNRTGASLAAWRMKHCGWDVEKAIDETNAVYEIRDKPELIEHLRRFYEVRILPERRAAPAQSEPQSQPQKGS